MRMHAGGAGSAQHMQSQARQQLQSPSEEGHYPQSALLQLA